MRIRMMGMAWIVWIAATDAVAQEAPAAASVPATPAEQGVSPAAPAAPEGPQPVAPAPEPSPPMNTAQPPAGSGPPPQVSEAWYGNPEMEETNAPRVVKRGKGVRTHDGFYLRLSLGAGYLSTGVYSDVMDLRIRGAAISTDLWIGGTPVPGFVVGGGYVIDISSSPTVATPEGKFRADATLSSATVGPFVDWYFDPTAGFHAGLLAGYASSRFVAHEVNMEATATGPGGSLFVGYDGWVGEQWAMGVLARATGAALSSSEGGVEESVYPGSLIVELTAVNH